MTKEKELLLDSEISRDLGFKIHYTDNDLKYDHDDSDSCCAISTVARIMDVTFEEAYRGLFEHGLAAHRNMAIRENIADYLATYGPYNSHIVAEKDYYETASQYLARTGAVNDERFLFLVFTSSHVFPIINGTIYDFSENYIDGYMTSPCVIFCFTNIKDREDFNKVFSPYNKKHKKVKKSEYITNFLPTKDRFKIFNPRKDKSATHKLHSDSIVRALSKISGMSYSKIQMFLYCTAVQNETVMVTVKTVKYVATKICDLVFYKENEDNLLSLYAFLKEHQTGSYIAILDTENALDCTSYYYVPIVDGVIYDDAFVWYDNFLGKPVIGYFKEEED